MVPGSPAWQLQGADWAAGPFDSLRSLRVPTLVGSAGAGQSGLVYFRGPNKRWATITCLR